MLLYGSEAWITAAEQKRLEAMEMWCYTRMLKIKWTDRITNEETLSIKEEKRNIMNAVRRRRGRLIGHILRQIRLLKQYWREKYLERTIGEDLGWNTLCK
jgi:hypothetical protein